MKSASKTTLLLTVIFMDLLTGMEFDLFVPSFPQLQSYFHLTPSWVEALLSVNYLGYCVSLFLVGGLADRFGRKPIIIIGLIIFLIGTLFCLLIPYYHFVLLGRLLQGIGVAAPSILSFLIIADAYSLKEQQFFMGVLNGAMNFAVAISPVIGSFIAAHFYWRGNFMALFILGVISLIMTLQFIPQYELPKQQEALSLKGYIDVLKIKPLLLLIINIVLFVVPYWIFVGMSPLLYIKDLGVSLNYFGFYQGVLAFIFAIGSIIFGIMIKNNEYDQKKLLTYSLIIFILSILTIGMAAYTDTKNAMLITLAILPFIIGQIVPAVILYPRSVSYLPHAKGRVSALIQGTRLILTSIALQIAGYYYIGTFRNIGIILCVVILGAIISLFYVIENREII